MKFLQLIRFFLKQPKGNLVKMMSVEIFKSLGFYVLHYQINA